MILVSALGGLLTASEVVKPPALSPNQIDAETIFARQAGTIQVPTGTLPAVVGAYLWGGRADINYRPFFQWELRLSAGSAALGHPRLRITTLGPSRQPLAAGPWQALPDLAAGASSELSYRQNCTIFPAYQVDLAWEGGTETFLAGDKGAVPFALSALSSQGFVIAVNLAYEADPDHPGAVDVTWSDWNVGGKPASGIVHTLHLYNAAGKDIKDLPFALPASRVLAVNAVAEQHAHLTAPAFATASMSVEEADETAQSEIQGFTTGKDIEVAFVHVDGGMLKAKVRNGLGASQDGLSVTITLQDAKGADLKAIEVPVGHLDAGDTVEVSAPLPGALAFAGYATTWKAAGAASAPASAPAGALGAGHDTLALGSELAVEHLPGVSLTVNALEHGESGLLIHGVLHNHSGHDLTALHLRVEALDGAETAVMSWRTARCAARTDEPLVLACPLANLSQLRVDQPSER